jgi:hypothetical protein
VITPCLTPYASHIGAAEYGDSTPMKTLMTETTVIAVVASTVDAMMLFRRVWMASTPFFSVFWCNMPARKTSSVRTHKCRGD